MIERGGATILRLWFLVPKSSQMRSATHHHRWRDLVKEMTLLHSVRALSLVGTMRSSAELSEPARRSQGNRQVDEPHSALHRAGAVASSARQLRFEAVRDALAGLLF